MVRFLVSHGFKLVVELEGVVAVVQKVGAVPDDAAPRENSAVLTGCHRGHVVDKPGPLLVVVELHAVGVSNLVVVYAFSFSSLLDPLFYFFIRKSGSATNRL